MDNGFGFFLADCVLDRIQFLDVHLFDVDTDRFESQLFEPATESDPNKASRSCNQYTHHLNVPEQSRGRNWNRSSLEAAILASRRRG